MENYSTEFKLAFIDNILGSDVHTLLDLPTSGLNVQVKLDVECAEGKAKLN